jgi:hypothetical protein
MMYYTVDSVYAHIVDCMHRVEWHMMYAQCSITVCSPCFSLVIYVSSVKDYHSEVLQVVSLRLIYANMIWYRSSIRHTMCQMRVYKIDSVRTVLWLL